MIKPNWYRVRLAAVLFALILPINKALAVTLTFDDAISGATSYSFDGDSDGTPDAVFSTTDPSGFNTFGPGTNMSYIDEPGLEGTTTLAPDLRVDFPLGAVGTLNFGFALSAGGETANLTVTFRVYDVSDIEIGSVTQLAAFTQPAPPTDSDYPEAIASVSFSGTAAYATFDFDNTDASRYIIDNFTGTFGSTERPPAPPSTPGATPIPVFGPAGLLLLSVLVAVLGALGMRRRI